MAERARRAAASEYARPLVTVSDSGPRRVTAVSCSPAAGAIYASLAGGAPRGAFVLFEGVDRAGKSTQAAKLVEALRREGIPAELWRFPDRKGTVTGRAIDEYLSAPAAAPAAAGEGGECASVGGDAAAGGAAPDKDTAARAGLPGGASLSDQAVHMMFAANRWEKSRALIEALLSGVTLVVDRYAYSGVAYTTAKHVPGCGIEWCKAPDAGLPAPDVTLWMALPPDAATGRGGFGGERYEDPTFQEQVRNAFAAVRDESFVDVDASGSVEEVHERLLPEALDAVRRCREGQPLLALWDRAPIASLQ